MLCFPPVEEVQLRRSPLREVICQVRFPPLLRIVNGYPVDFQERIRQHFPELGTEHAGPSPAPYAANSGNKLSAVQRLYASGFMVHDYLRLPQRVAQQFTFGVPRQAYSDGRLELRFVRAASEQMAAVSEIWLIRGPS